MFEWIANFIFETLLQEFIAVVAGIGFVLLFQNQWIKFKYGGWKVEIWKNDQRELCRDISSGKLKEIQSEAADLAVFLKGVASPYGWFNCDIIADGERLGLLEIRKKEKKFMINFDHNPQPKSKTVDDLTQIFVQEVMTLIEKQTMSNKVQAE